MGDSHFARYLQGGGVYVEEGTVSIVNSQVYSNQANYVRDHSRVPIAPMGNLLTNLPRLTLAQLCGRRSGQLQGVRAAET